MANKVLSELFYPFRAQHNLRQQKASQYVLKLDWSRDEFCQSLYENPGPKHVMFVRKAITARITFYLIICLQSERIETYQFEPCSKYYREHDFDVKFR